MKILVSASNMTHIKNFHIPYIEKFKELGNDVSILASGEGADFNIPFKKSVFSLKNIFQIPKIRKILKKEKFDVVYLHTTLCAFFVRLAMKGLKNRPYVINTVHGYLFSDNTSKIKKSIYLFCEKLLKKQTDDIVVMNSEDYKIATENKLSLNNVYFCNGMGVKFNDLPNVEKQISDKTRLVFVGEISKRKNQAFLVKALQHLPNYTLTLVGDGSERKNIEKLIKKLSLEDRVTITGFTKDVYNYLLNSDIYVCASQIEGLPFNIMEAMYARLPIVATNIKGHKDLLSNSQLYDYNNMEQFVSLVKSTSKEKMNYNLEKYKLENVLEENIKIYTSFSKLNQNAK